jgi:hypothetical protein
MLELSRNITIPTPIACSRSSTRQSGVLVVGAVCARTASRSSGISSRLSRHTCGAAPRAAELLGLSFRSFRYRLAEQGTFESEEQ